MKAKLITEFIGTFFLYLIISLSAVAGFAGDFAPLAIGLGLAALIFASGFRSKAHFNPAVTAAFFITKISSKRISFYCIVVLLVPSCRLCSLSNSTNAFPSDH